MKRILLLLILISFFSLSYSQTRKTENVVIVTLDGMRWQEVFTGIDSALLNNLNYTEDSSFLANKFWNANTNERRERLFPFLWHIISEKGQLYGNRNIGNYVNVTNPYQFSYPGYNEIFTGYPDTSINSNDKIENPNENVLEFINKQKGFEGKVAAFTTWDVFPYILNEKRSRIYVNSDVDTLAFNSPEFKLINELQFLTPKPLNVRPDILTYAAAKEYLKEFKPRVLYIAFDETDDYAHGGHYDQYIKSAHAQDGMISDIWNTIQAMPQYKNKTTLIVTCDHGRGDINKDDWRGHGKDIQESGQIWIAVMGPDSKLLGEVKTKTQLYQRQLATTIAALLGLNFKPKHEVMQAVKTILSN